MANYKVYSTHKMNRYQAPVMTVEAKNEDEAKRATRLNDFPEEWTVSAGEVKDKNPKNKKQYERN